MKGIYTIIASVVAMMADILLIHGGSLILLGFCGVVIGGFLYYFDTFVDK